MNIPASDFIKVLNEKMIITSVIDLTNWLRKHGMPVEDYRKDQAKTVEQLYSEILSGEARLEENPPLRILNLVGIILEQNDKILYEQGQQFKDGRYRVRDILPGEKLKPDEQPLSAATRWLIEEMAEFSKSIELDESSCHTSKKLQESPSYPGLTTRYILHYFNASSIDLPCGPFSTIERDSSDIVCKHFWIWKPKG